jgi:SulP family sulfate permease
MSLAAIAIIIIVWGFIAGVLFGVLIGCAIFALNASRVNAIKFSFDGTNYRSSLDRDPTDLALLSNAGQKIQGMCLQSYLFLDLPTGFISILKAYLRNKRTVVFWFLTFGWSPGSIRQLPIASAK